MKSHAVRNGPIAGAKAMSLLTASDLRRMLRDVHTVEEFTNAMRREVRVPETAELYRAAGAIAAIRHKLFEVALADVAVEPVTERVEEKV